MRRSKRGGSGAGISIDASTRLSHCSWPGFIKVISETEISAQQFRNACGDGLHQPQTSETFVTAGEDPLVRPNEFHAARLERGGVSLRGRVPPQSFVHG